MSDPKRGYSNTDERQQGGFSNDDDNIEHQPSQDIAENNDEPPASDPAGERHAPPSEIDPDAWDERDTDVL